MTKSFGIGLVPVLAQSYFSIKTILTVDLTTIDVLEGNFKILDFIRRKLYNIDRSRCLQRVSPT